MADVKPIPQGQNSIIPHLTVNNAAGAIEFYKKAFGAEEHARMLMPDGKSVMHAHLTIGPAHLMLADEFQQAGCSQAPQKLGGSPVTLHLYVNDVDAVFKQAVAAGAKPTMPPTDMFWGDRYSKVTDPAGHEWSLATHKEDVPPQQMKERAAAMFAPKG